VSKGISAHLLKENAKRRRSKQQIKDEKKAEEMKQREIARKLAEYDQFRPSIEETKELVAEKEHYRQLLGQFYADGVIKEDSNKNWVPVEDPMERESIRSKTKQKMQEEAMSQQTVQENRPEFDQTLLDDMDKMDDLN